jgi:hypothetical protein
MSPHSIPDRPGYSRITYEGRAYPTPELARERMRMVLWALHIEVPPEDIIVREQMPGAICPWDAFAWVPTAVWDERRQKDGL